MKRALAPIACVATAFSFWACGGADLGLFAPLDGSITQDDAQASGDASSSSDAALTLDVVSSQDGGALDAATEAAPPPYQDPGIACGNDHCDPDASLCCGTPTSYYPQETYSFACESLTDLVQCAAGLPLYCDSDEECPNGESCCATLGYQSSYSKVACQKGACVSTVYSQELHFCDPNASDCSGNTTCKPAPNLTGYYACE